VEGEGGRELGRVQADLHFRSRHGVCAHVTSKMS
jgi:hypothetical protein